MIHIGIQTKEAKAETETNPVIAETKIKKSSVLIKIVERFCACYSIHFLFITVV